MKQTIVHIISILLFILMSTPSTSSFAAGATPQPQSSPEGSYSESKEKPSEKGTSKSGVDEILQLPASLPGNEDVQTLKMGESIKLDHLGPIILNSDGTTRQISNWDTLSEREREVTWRRIKKRNEERRQQLLLENDIQQKNDET